MSAHQEDFEKTGINLAAIGLAGMDHARRFRHETGIEFPLLVDSERRAYRAAGLGAANIFHLLRSDNKVARARAKGGGHRQHQLGKNPFQLGGSFVFAPGNRDLFAHISQTFGDNAEVEELFKVHL